MNYEVIEFGRFDRRPDWSTVSQDGSGWYAAVQREDGVVLDLCAKNERKLLKLMRDLGYR